MTLVPLHAARPVRDFDYVLVGAGLQNALLSLALRHHRPNARVALVEARHQIGGKHTWCFHEQDVAAQARAYLEPLVVQCWPSYAVAFPGHRRQVRGQYQAVTSARLAEVVQGLGRTAGYEILLAAPATRVAPDHVLLQDGTRLNARLVVDATGPSAGTPAGAFQKFVGLTLSLAAPAPRSEPMLMDACVEQLDGYRFVYVLPWSADRVLIEDTYYSTSPELDTVTLKQRILRYAAQRGYLVRSIEDEERGVLPLPLSLAKTTPQAAPLMAGFGGGWFHPTTGYSFPAASRLAEYVATREPEQVFGAALDAFWSQHRRQVRFGVLLNRLLFSAFAPGDRRNVLERFYRLPAATIQRFYALQTTPSDRARIVCGAPPRGFSLKRALSPGANA